MADHTLILYIRATDKDEHELLQRAKDDPKPLFYREAFLDEQLDAYMTEKALAYVAMIAPDHFVRWVFPKLFRARIPRYEAIAAEHGYVLTTDELKELNDEEDFLTLMERVVERKQ